MNGEQRSGERPIIVSNRLPIVVKRGEEDRWLVEPGSGGLVTAMAPVLRHRGGVWIGWPGAIEEDGLELEGLFKEAGKDAGYTLLPVLLSAEEQAGYYQGFSNEILWPLFHDLPSHCVFDPAYWKIYQSANRKFAETIAGVAGDDDFIWVHDYHLIAVANELRQLRAPSRIAFFLHIPFPALDIFVRLPWRFQVLQALLQYDLIGFQTLRDRRNFLQCVRTLFRDVEISGKGQVVTVRAGSREVRVGAFPISIDFHEFAKLAATKAVADKAWYLHEDLPQRQILLGVDRLDYTKGVPEKLNAYRNALQRYPELQQNTVLVQVLVPSRRDIPKYLDLKTEIERMVGEINGEFTQSGWVPIHYIFRTLERTELVAYYRTAEIALVTPLKDGMNLVAKEYCASNLEGNGVLILSEFAGAAAQLQNGALLVNPHDIEGVADAIHRAYTMSEQARRSRMRKLRRSIRKYNIFWWVNSFLQAAIAKHLDNFPVVEDYIPRAEALE